MKKSEIGSSARIPSSEKYGVPLAGEGRRDFGLTAMFDIFAGSCRLDLQRKRSIRHAQVPELNSVASLIGGRHLRHSC